MKTIFITAFHREQVKDILLGDIRKVLENDRSVRTVFLVPDYRVSELKRTFAGSPILFEGIADTLYCPPLLNSFFEKIIRRFRTLSHTTRRVCRFFDLWLISTSAHNELFETYRPDTVFLSRADLSLDQRILREAKRRRIRTVGMISAWNERVPSRFFLRLVPDEFIVWNNTAKHTLIQHEKNAAKRVFISGVPRLDRYRNGSHISREVFCGKYGIDPAKKIILFISVPHVNPEEHRVLTLLNSAVEDGAISKDTVILIRNYPSDETAKGSIVWSDVLPSPHIVFDNGPTFWGSGKSYIDGLRRETTHAADSLFHSDLVITSNDTMGIDARMFGKSVIDLSLLDQTSGDLLQTLKKFLENSAYGVKGRKKNVQGEFYKLDGKAGWRIAHHLMRSMEC